MTASPACVSLGSMSWLPPKPFTMSSLRAGRRAALVLGFITLPLASAVALHALHAYADDRERAALQLETLGNDLNRTAADAGWNVALRVPRAIAFPPPTSHAGSGSV